MPLRVIAPSLRRTSAFSALRDAFSRTALLSLTIGVIAAASGQSLDDTAPPTAPALVKAAQLAAQGQGRAARAIYQAYLQAHPGDYEALLALAKLADRQGEGALAEATFQKLARFYPGDRAALIARARFVMRRAAASDPPSSSLGALIDEYLRQASLSAGESDASLLSARGEWALIRGDLDQAYPDLRRAVALAPDSTEAHLALGRYFLKTAQLQAARDAGLQAMELSPDDSDALFLMAQLLAAAQKPDQALAYAQKSQAVDMGVNPTRTRLIAQLLETLGRPDDAVEALTQLAREAPGDPQIALKLARLRAAAGRPQEAARDYQRAFAQNPALRHDARRYVWRLIHERQAPAALAQLTPFLFLDAAQQAEAFHAAASLLVQERDALPDSAAQAAQFRARLDALAATSPPDALLALDRVKLTLVAEPVSAQSDTTRAALEALAQTPPGRSDDELAAGQALFLLQRFAQARQRLDDVDGAHAQEYLRATDALESLGAVGSAQTLVQRGLSAGASEDLKAAQERLTLRQQRANAQIRDGNAFFQQKNYAAARDAYLQAQTLWPDWETPPLRLGDAYEQLKDPVKAYGAYQRAVAMTPSLLDSQGFAKKYRRLAKRAGKSDARRTP